MLPPGFRPSETGRGYLTRLVPELAAEAYPDQKIWSLASPDNIAANTLLLNIGMSAIGRPNQYQIDDGVEGSRQLYAARAGDILQTSQAYVKNKYPAI